MFRMAQEHLCPTDGGGGSQSASSTRLGQVFLCCLTWERPETVSPPPVAERGEWADWALRAETALQEGSSSHSGVWTEFGDGSA